MHADRGPKAVLTGSAWQTYKRLLSYVRPHRPMFLLGVLGATLFAASMVYFAKFAQAFGDGAFEKRDPSAIVDLPLTLIALFALRGLGDFIQTYCMGHVGRHVVKRLRTQIFERMMQLPIGYYDRNSSSVLLSRLTYNTEQVGQAATDSLVVMVREALTILGSIALLFYLNARLALIAMTMGPLVAWLVTIINRKFRRYSRRIQDSMGDVTRVAKETLDAPRIVKVYNAQGYQNAQFETVNEYNRRSYMRLVLTKGLSNPIVQLVMAFGAAFVLSIAIADVVHRRSTPGELMAFLVALVNISQPLRSLVGAAGPLQQGIAAGQGIFDLLDEPPEPAGGTLVAERLRGDIEFERVSFSYPVGKGVTLQELSLKIPAGSVVAIVGKTGSGKSTTSARARCASTATTCANTS